MKEISFVASDFTAAPSSTPLKMSIWANTKLSRRLDGLRVTVVEGEFIGKDAGTLWECRLVPMKEVPK